MPKHLFKISKKELDHAIFFIGKYFSERRLFLKKMNLMEETDDQFMALENALKILRNLRGDEEREYRLGSH